MEEKIETIALLCCLHFDVRPEEFFSKSHTRMSAYARVAFTILMRKYTNKTVVDIGRIVNRTHATLITGASSIQHIISSDIEIIESKYKRLAA